MVQSPPNALHYGGLVAQKGDGFEPPLCFIQFSSFSGNAEITTETDKGHTGTRSLNLGEDRTEAKGAPELEDKLRLEMGLEDMWYHVLGKYVKATKGTKVQEYTITPDGSGNLPLVSILHGFNYEGGLVRGFANSICNELEIKMNAKDAPTVNAKYISDFPIYDVPEPTIIFPASHPQSLKAGQLSVYMGEPGALNEVTDKIVGLTESTVTVSNNTETSASAGNDLGEEDKDVGELTVEGSMTIKYNANVANLEKEWATGKKVGTDLKVTYDSLFKSLRFKYQGQLIESVTGTPATDYFYSQIINLDKVDIKSVKPTESGDGNKTIAIDFSASASTTGANVIEVTIDSTLTDMHITTV
ncbi:MAG: hypothetical protein K8E24_014325 [Methanobacterium paludis]|nr:hypothetical protein [Methanobacterium paludis]